MGKITRRKLIQSAPAALVIGTPAVAAAAEIIHEDVYTQVRRLARELSHALVDYNDGRWHVIVYPSSARDYAVGFMDSSMSDAVCLPIQVHLLKDDDRLDYHMKEAARLLTKKRGGNFWYEIGDEFAKIERIKTLKI